MEPWKLQPARDLGLPAGQRLKSVRRESGLVEAGTQHLWWLLVRIYLRLVHRLTVVGGERLPASGSFVVVANHSSHLDALVLAVSHKAYLEMPRGSLCERVRDKGGRVAHFANLQTATVVDRALDVLGPSLVGRVPNLPEDTFFAVDRYVIVVEI